MNKDDSGLEDKFLGFQRTVRSAGIRLTPQRLEIFREIAGRVDHPDAEAVYRAVLPRMPTVSLDTVYRTLWMLADLGLISVLGTRRESVRFDADPEPHHHFVCVRCGFTRDFPATGGDPADLPPAARQYGTILDVRIEARGICAACCAAGEARLSGEAADTG